MKFFASNLLADAFGRQFGALDPREIECKLKLILGFTYFRLFPDLLRFVT